MSQIGGDEPLREVALGGPDSAGRMRLVQRIARTRAGSTQCAPALANAEETWNSLGLGFDEETMRLTSAATLMVAFEQPPVAQTQCDPQVQGGYLAADNQLIRVQISGYDSRTKTWKLVWGFNNASFLYRVTVIDNVTLKLASTPIDSYHTPQLGKAVEVLRRAVDLTDNNYVAAHNGVVFTTTKAYASDTQQLVLPAPGLPGDYVKDQQLFLRLWEQEVAFIPGKPVDLAGTGLQSHHRTSRHVGRADGGPVLDLRGPAQHPSMSIPGAISRPRSRLKVPRMWVLSARRDRLGQRGLRAAQRLPQQV